MVGPEQSEQQSQEIEAEAGEIRELREMPRRIVSALIWSKDGKLLMAKKPAKGKGSYADYWHIPGGGVEPGQTDIVALHGEVQDEVGLDITPYQAVEVPFDEKEDAGHRAKKLDRDSGEMVIAVMEFHRWEIHISDKNVNEIKLDLSKGEFVEARWFGREELPSVQQIPGGREFFQRLGYIPKDPSHIE